MPLHGQTQRAGPELLQSASSRACLRLAASCHGYKVSCFEGEKIKSGLSASPQLPWEPWQCLVRSAQVREKLRPPPKAAAHSKASSSQVLHTKFGIGK